MSDFRAKLFELANDAASNPTRYGAGVRLLFSSGCRALPSALLEASKSGIDARGVGRKHVLIEIEDVLPDAGWVADQGEKIAAYFDRIDGDRPTIGFDRHFD